MQESILDTHGSTYKEKHKETNAKDDTAKVT